MWPLGRLTLGQLGRWTLGHLAEPTPGGSAAENPRPAAAPSDRRGRAGLDGPARARRELHRPRAANWPTAPRPSGHLALSVTRGNLRRAELREVTAASRSTPRGRPRMNQDDRPTTILPVLPLDDAV